MIKPNSSLGPRQGYSLPSLNSPATEIILWTSFFELNRKTCGVSFSPPTPFSALFASHRLVTSLQNGELWIMITHIFRHRITLLYSLLQCWLSICEWNRKSHIWVKLTSLWLPDSPKWTTRISNNIQLSNILRKYPHLLLRITCWTSVTKAQPTTHKN